MADFLLELGLEEIPARMIASAEAELGCRVTDLLSRERLLAADSKATTFSTPRRLGIRVESLSTAQPDVEEKLTGPSWAIAFKDGEPGPAAIAFARKAGVDPSALEKIVNAKGEYVGATVHRQGRSTAEILITELPKEVLSLYWAKNMYWRAGKPERFVRPLRWLVALLDQQIVPLEIAGIAASNTSRGHRILHGGEPVLISSPGNYLPVLRAAFVDAEVASRRHSIRKALDHVTRAIAETPNARWREDHDLVDTVVHLTEWPTVLYGSFEAEYLTLPEEVLVTVMRDHQKYFAVETRDGKLAPHFLTVLNTQLDQAGQAIVRHGNERVLRSRFKDAQFFWDTDQKTSLIDREAMLESVTFQRDLGSYAWKKEQTLDIANLLASEIQRARIEPDKEALLPAVRLAKTDLTAELVKEFTELQGIVGGLYARAQGLSEAVAEAIYWQYRPASTDDEIPPSIPAQLLGIADRIQTITAMFAIGNAPTGSKDPFALRRAANAIIKILAESTLPLTVSQVVEASRGQIIEKKTVPEPALTALVTAFFQERLSFYLKEVRGYSYDVVASVLASASDDVRDAIARAEAVTKARGSEDFLAVAAAVKRIKNILRQAQEKGEIWTASSLDTAILTLPEEQALLVQSRQQAKQIETLRQTHQYTEALEAVASLRPAVDAFFDKVMVMAPEKDLRSARLALIQSVLSSFAGIADFSEIVIS